MTTTNQQDYEYIGEELDVFALATNWKNYWFKQISPYIGNEVLEVGAGIGGTTSVIFSSKYQRFTALEPDSDMVAFLKNQQQKGELDSSIEIVHGTIDGLNLEANQFDSILYIDVLEHIEAHQQEIINAARYLRPGGYLVVLSPAYQFLYTEFDESIGHYRRYRAKDLHDLTPETLKLEKSFYLDSLGVMTSLVNKFILHSPSPNANQIKLWDNLLVPLSRSVFDRIVGYRLGRSVICVWQKTR